MFIRDAIHEQANTGASNKEHCIVNKDNACYACSASLGDELESCILNLHSNSNSNKEFPKDYT